MTLSADVNAGRVISAGHLITLQQVNVTIDVTEQFQSSRFRILFLNVRPAFHRTQACLTEANEDASKAWTGTMMRPQAHRTIATIPLISHR
jgi:hypothetical protein